MLNSEFVTNQSIVIGSITSCRVSLYSILVIYRYYKLQKNCNTGFQFVASLRTFNLDGSAATSLKSRQVFS